MTSTSSSTSDPTPSDELADLAQAVRRLTPSWQRPERFHEAKSEIAAALLRLSRALAGRVAPPVQRVAVPLRVTAAPLRVPVPPPRVIHVPMPRRASPTHRHRYPRPPAMPASIQPTLNLGG